MPHKKKISVMRKKIYLFPLFLLGFFMLATTSCLDTKNDNEVVIDEAWKALNETRFAAVAADPSFTALSSQSNNGKVYWKESTVITNTDEKNTIKTTVEGRPEFTDTVVVRYEGWFVNKEGKEEIFDSTENPSSRSKIDYMYNKIPSPYPNYAKSQLPVNKVVDGWTTLLQNMKAGEERLVCIPQELGYGGNASNYQPTTSAPSYEIIPAYTTLWFRIKLYKIIPMKGRK